MSKELTIIIPEEQAKDVRAIAKKQKQSASEVVRDAVRNYTFHQNWKKSADIRKKIARELNITSDQDVIRQFGV